MKKILVSLIVISFAIGLQGQSNYKTTPRKFMDSFLKTKCNSKNGVAAFSAKFKVLDFQIRSKVFRQFESTGAKLKVDSVVHQALDAKTNTMYDFYKSELAYDSTGRNSMYATYYKDGTTVNWIGEEKYEYVYDDSGRKIIEIYFDWDLFTNAWVEDDKHQMVFDSEGKLVNEYYYTWEDKWKMYLSKEYSYDAHGNVLLCTRYDADSETGQMIIRNKMEYTYNSSNNVLTETEYWCVWEPGNFYPSTKYEYIYNNDNKVILKIGYMWDYDHWRFNSKEEYAYNGGRNTQEIYYNMNGDDWQAAIKREYVYNSNGNMIQETHYGWDSVLKEWGSSRKYDYTFDEFGNNIAEIFSERNSNLEDYVPDSKYETLFDYDYLVDDLLYVDLLEGFNNKPIQATNYSFKDNDWSLTSIVKLYYSNIELESAVNNITEASIIVYPNPTSDFIKFKIGISNDQYTFQMVDLNGKRVVSRQVNDNSSISIKNLPKGVYLYKLLLKDKVINGKVVVK